ncbi:ectonucleotide pyrophosphatase/phosphodiesterase [Formosa sp. PL04]|uniref:alkaline phosphatase family protein n=1 Tax=Formosa sp. PL04 TaxID=3081755 RepID=UPI002981FF96|nr:ectonucleotide pyrophosphatase/phosphodiesterase [Formosa sp. PL04]MDW5290388.1 ectonucleotide pyrophosphatase/phosphodiesterase [Formosa sp. PL04]
MIKQNLTSFLLLLAITLVISSCNSAAKPIEINTNSKESQDKPYVILISLDGFRWDYVEQYNPPALSSFIKNGAKAESLIPVFPSKTFPNHYSIATGMYPDKHAIIGNSFFNYDKNEIYSIGNREQVTDGSFYEGSPLWVEAEQAGMISASFFFVGSEAEIKGVRPTYYYDYDGGVNNSTRVNQALKWLELPASKRPHLITMYFSDMDDAGHKFGPNNEAEIKKALFNLDTHLGDLFKGIKETGLPVNIIVVSDHGMADLSVSNLIPLEDVTNDDLFLTIDSGSILNIHPKNKTDVETVFELLKSKENHFKVYKTEDTPGFEYTPTSKNWGPIQVLPDYNYYFASERRIESKKASGNLRSGVHGYDPIYKEMHGVFYANGPAIKTGASISSLRNIHIYPLILELLDLDIPENIDGNLEDIKCVLKN